MTEVIFIDKVLCFSYSYIGLIPNGNILTVLPWFFTEEELNKAKSCVYEMCMKHIQDVRYSKTEETEGRQHSSFQNHQL